MVALGIASHAEMTGHMPMFTQKLSEIFCFFNLDQISDMCSFGVSIGFFGYQRANDNTNLETGTLRGSAQT